MNAVLSSILKQDGRLLEIQRNLSRYTPFHESRKKVFKAACLTSNDMRTLNMVYYKRNCKKLETNQRAIKRNVLNVELKGRILNTIMRQRTRGTDIAEYVTNAKWKVYGHMAQMNVNKWAIRSTE